jgi:hypothetical protein
VSSRRSWLGLCEEYITNYESLVFANIGIDENELGGYNKCRVGPTARLFKAAFFCRRQYERKRID